MRKKPKKWKALTAAVVLAVGFWAAPQGAGAVTSATAVSGTGTTITVEGTSYPITYNSDGATATGNYATAVGSGASAKSDYSIALGYGALVTKDTSRATVGLAGIAIGSQVGDTAGAKVTAKYGIAIGTGSSVSTSISMGAAGIAIGYGAQVDDIDQQNYGAVAIGQSASSLDLGVAVGSLSTTKGYGTAIGYGAVSSLGYGTAVGYNAKVYAVGGTVLGNGTVGVKDQESSPGVGGIAIGTHFVNSWDAPTVTANYGIAMGAMSSVTGTKSLALGFNSSATAENAVALGQGSVADTAKTISVGSSNTTSGFTRKIVNVSNGSANTDAATYGQLVNAQAVTDESSNTTTYTPYEADSNGLVTVKTNDGGTAFTFKTATATSALVIGDETKHWVDLSWNGAADSTSVTRGENSTAYGYLANASDDGALAIGYGANASRDYTTAVGSGASAKSDYSIALGYGALVENYDGGGIWEDTDGVAGIAIGSQVGNTAGAKVTADYGIAIGTGSFVQAIGNTGRGAGIAIGYGAKAQTRLSLSSEVPLYGSVAIGQSASSENRSVAIGGSTSATDLSVAIGYNTVSNVDHGTAVGVEAATYVQGGVVLGNGTVGVEGQEQDMYGHVDGECGIAIGARHWDSDSVPTVTGSYGIAMGTSSSVTGKKSLALGYGSSATAENAVALGQGSVADTANTISVGTSSSTRKIVNVTAGSATTDAANYGQLVKNTTYTASNGSVTIQNNAGGTAFTINGLGTGSCIVDYDTSSRWLSTDFGSSVTHGTNSTAYGSGANASASYATAVGYNSLAKSDNSIALGYRALVTNYDGGGIYTDTAGLAGIAIGSQVGGTAGAKVTVDYGIAIGTGSSVSSGMTGEAAGIAIGYGAEVEDWITGAKYGGVAIGQSASSKGMSVAIGSHSTAAKAYSVTIGYNTVSRSFYGTAVGFGAATYVPAGVVLGNGTVGVEGQENDDGRGGIAIGSMSSSIDKAPTVTGSYGIAVGTSSSVAGKNSLALGHESSATAENAVALGPGSLANTANTISVGTSSSTRKIVNVTAGSATTDAANYGQLVKNTTYTVSNGSVTIQNNASGTAFTIDGLNSAFANGTIEENETEAISGDTAYAYLNPAGGDYVKSGATTGINLKALDTKIGAEKAITDLYVAGDNLEQKIYNVAQTRVASNQTVSFESGKNVIKDVADNILVTFTPGAVAQNNNNMVSGGQVWANDVANDDYELGTDGYFTVRKNNGTETAFRLKLSGDGAITENNTALITGGTAYTYLNPTSGAVVQSGATTAANLNALDDALVDVDTYTVQDGQVVVKNNKGGTAFTITGIGSGSGDSTIVRVNTDDPSEILIGRSTNGADYSAVKTIDVSNGGKNYRKITGVAEGVNTNDAANYGQLVKKQSYTVSGGTLTVYNNQYTGGDATEDQIAFTVTGIGSGSGTEYTAGDGIAIADDAISANIGDGLQFSDSKITVNVDDDTIKVKDGALYVNANGEVADANTGLVTGSQVWNAIQNHTIPVETVSVEDVFNYKPGVGQYYAKPDLTLSEDITALDTGLNDTYNQLIKIKDYAASNGSVTLETNGGQTFKITGLGSGSGSGTTYTAGNGIAIETTSDNTSTISVKVDGDDLTVSDKGLAVKKDGKVESGNTGLVTGGTVYDAMRSMDNQVSQLSDDINKVGAGAAALAALHPEGYDPNDKLSFAVGYGHYKGESAGALGAFFKPNADTTVSVAGTVGNGDSMMNMGVSFKLGSKGKKAGTYRSAMDLVQRIDALEAVMNREIQRNDKQDSRLNAQAQKIAQLQADIARMQQQIAGLLSDSGMEIR